MDLRLLVQEYVARVRRSPADAGDPRLLDRLQKFAQESWSGAFVALFAPMAKETREARTTLPGNLPVTQTTNRQSIIFPGPIEILGFNPLLSLAGNGTLPTLADIDVQIDINQERQLGAADGISSPGGTGVQGQFVSLGHYSIIVPRVVGWRVNDPTPDIGFTYRWKRTAVFADTFIGMGIFYRYISRS